MKFGLHVSIAGGIENAVTRALDLKCDCFQVFVANPRSWSGEALREERVQAFRKARAETKLGPVVVHQTYLPNLATPDANDRKRAREHFLRQLNDAARIGAEFYVLHAGSTKGSAVNTAIRHIGEALKRGIRATPGGPTILLENTAGGKNTIGQTPEELAGIAEHVGDVDRVGVCLDTAHAYAAGMDIAAPGGMAKALRAYSDAFGSPAVRLLHLNDLRTAFGSHHDRHEHIGKGAIGKAGFQRILRARGVASIPGILETPVDDDGDDARNLRVTRALQKRFPPKKKK